MLWKEMLLQRCQLNRMYPRNEPVSFQGNHTEIIIHLKPMSKLIRLSKKRPEPNRHPRRDGSSPQDDFIHRPRCHPNGPRHGILRNPLRLEVLLEPDFTRRNLRSVRQHNHNA